MSWGDLVLETGASLKMVAPVLGMGSLLLESGRDSSGLYQFFIFYHFFKNIK